MQESLGLIIAIVGTGIAIVGTVLALMFWVRQESNELRKEAKEDRKDLIQLVRSIELEVISFKSIVNEEMKDFHYKLLEIEKNKRKLI